MRNPEIEECILLNMIASPLEEVFNSQTVLHLKMPKHGITHVTKLEKIKTHT